MCRLGRRWQHPSSNISREVSGIPCQWHPWWSEGLCSPNNLTANQSLLGVLVKCFQASKCFDHLYQSSMVCFFGIAVLGIQRGFHEAEDIDNHQVVKSTLR